MWITDIELDGPHKDNYELTHTTAQTTANIARRTSAAHSEHTHGLSTRRGDPGRSAHGRSGDR